MAKPTGLGEWIEALRPKKRFKPCVRQILRFILEMEAPNGAKMKLQYEGAIDPLAFCVTGIY